MDKLKIKKDVPLRQFSTFKIGGEAKYYVEIESKEELVDALAWARENEKETYFLGGGSNILINDNGVNGLVVKINNNQITVKGDRLECGAGALLSQAVSLSAGNSLSGLEWAAGIPGSVGGAVRGNAGAFGRSCQDNIETALVYDIKKEVFQIFSRNDCKFDYRYSVFKIKPHLVIWEVTMRLFKGDQGSIRKEINEHITCRGQKQPKLPSAGSVFKNIEIGEIKKFNNQLALRAEKEEAVKGGFLPAGWLIEQMGIKGKTIGGAKISLEHGNFIVNTSKAKAEDVVMLISYIKQQIRDHYGIQMQEEIQYFGF